MVQASLPHSDGNLTSLLNKDYSPRNRQKNSGISMTSVAPELLRQHLHALRKPGYIRGALPTVKSTCHMLLGAGADLLGGPLGARRQAAHFASHDRKTTTLLARPSGFDDRIERQQVGLFVPVTGRLVRISMFTEECSEGDQSAPNANPQCMTTDSGL